jgi:hypothetical protein
VGRGGGAGEEVEDKSIFIVGTHGGHSVHIQSISF